LRARNLAIGAVLLCPLVRITGLALNWQAHGYYIWTTFETTADALAVGCLLSIMQTRVARNQWVLGACLIGTVIFLTAFSNDGPLVNFYQTIGVSILNICIALIINYCVNAPVRMLNAKPMTFVGQISYSIYLWQMIFIMNVFRLPLGINLMLIFIAACASYYLIEQPMLRLRSRLTPKMDNIRIAATTT
jgi:peptidoglycan/LPS O-acetylase OafA/YrhL